MAIEKRPRMITVWFMLTAAPILAAAVAAFVAVLIGIGIHRDGEVIAAWTFRSLPYILMATHAILFLMLLAFIRADGITLSCLGWRLPAGKKSLWLEPAVGLVTGMVLWVFIAFALTPLLELAQRVIGDLQLGTGAVGVGRLVAANRIPWLVVGSVSAGIVEESIYRGYAMRRLGSRMGRGWALVVSSILFGFVHFGEGLWPMLGTMILGSLLVGISRWRGNLVAPAVTHAVINTATILSL
jgi:membrane protease YdiL (CAAX protease family)